MIALMRAGTAALALSLVLGVITSARAQQANPTATPVTYQDVVKLLRSGQSEAEILEVLKKSPIDVSFTLGESQANELRKMRVSDELIDALKNLKKQPSTHVGDVSDLVLILDCSGSMTDKTKEGPTKMEAAKQVVTDLIQGFPSGRRLAFIVYGHDKQRACEAVDVVRPLGALDDAGRRQLLEYIARLQPTGHTPLAGALAMATGEVTKAKGLLRVVLITDGMETCHGDPVKAAAALAEKANAEVDVVGFVLKPEESRAVDLIARAGRGKYYDAQTRAALRAELSRVTQVQLPAERPQEGFASLFNGRDLTGWQVDGGDPKSWSAETGAIVAANRGRASRNWLLTERSYSDFVLRLEFQLTAGTNSGIALRTQPDEGELAHLEVQVADGSHPDVARNPLQQTGALFTLALDQPARLRPSGSWNQMEIALSGSSLRVSINGQPVVSTQLDKFADKAVKFPALRRTSGHIGLQNWDGTVRFRRIELKEQTQATAQAATVRPTVDEGKPSVAEEKVPDDLPPVLRALVEDLQDKAGKVRRTAAESLAKMGEKAKPAAPAIVQRVKDDVGDANSFDYNGAEDGCCKAAALVALKTVAPEKVAAALFGARTSKNVLVKNWASRELTALATGSETPSRQTRRGPNEPPGATAAVSVEMSSLVAGLTDDLQDGRGSVRRTAAECLGALGEKAKDAVPALIARVADDVGGQNSFDYNGAEDGCCKAAALDALKKLAPDQVQEALLKARKSKNDLVRAWASAKLVE